MLVVSLPPSLPWMDVSHELTKSLGITNRESFRSRKQRKGAHSHSLSLISLSRFNPVSKSDNLLLIPLFCDEPEPVIPINECVQISAIADFGSFVNFSSKLARSVAVE